MMSTVTKLPVAPLVPYIRYRERLAGGRQALAEMHHERLGVTVAGASRMFDCKYDWITLRQADKLCLVLGLEVGSVWGWQFYHNLGRKEESGRSVTAAS